MKPKRNFQKNFNYKIVYGIYKKSVYYWIRVLGLKWGIEISIEPLKKSIHQKKITNMPLLFGWYVTFLKAK